MLIISILEDCLKLHVALFFEISFSDKSQGSRVYAVTKPRRLRAVREEMAQMGIPVRTPDLGPCRKEGIILSLFYIALY